MSVRSENFASGQRRVRRKQEEYEMRWAKAEPREIRPDRIEIAQRLVFVIGHFVPTNRAKEIRTNPPVVPVGCEAEPARRAGSSKQTSVEIMSDRLRLMRMRWPEVRAANSRKPNQHLYLSLIHI